MIAFDSVTQLTAASASYTIPTGATTLLIGVVGAIGSDTITGATVAGNAATLVNKVLNPGTNGRYIYLFLYNSPPTGSQTIAITGTGLSDGHIIYYTGTSTNALDANVTDTAPDGTVAHGTELTTTTNNCWMVSYVSSSNGNTLGAGAGTTIRVLTYTSAFFDSNASITPAGSYTLNYTVSNAGAGLAITQCSIKPLSTVVMSEALFSGAEF